MIHANLPGSKNFSKIYRLLRRYRYDVDDFFIKYCRDDNRYDIYSFKRYDTYR